MEKNGRALLFSIMQSSCVLTLLLNFLSLEITSDEDNELIPPLSPNLSLTLQLNFLVNLEYFRLLCTFAI